MKVGIACDHHGVKLKQKITKYLTKEGYEVINYGTDSKASVDYPDYAQKIGEAIREKEIQFGFLICGTGIGMCIAANKMKDIRCARPRNIGEAKMCRLHNNANVMAISSKNSFLFLKNRIDAFLQTSYSGIERHNTRLKKIEELK